MIAIVIFFLLGLLFPIVLPIGLALWFMAGIYRLLTK